MHAVRRGETGATGDYAHVPSMLEDVERAAAAPRSTSSRARSSARRAALGVPVPLHDALCDRLRQGAGALACGDADRACIVGCGAVGSLFAANLATLDDVEVWAYDVVEAHVARDQRRTACA